MVDINIKDFYIPLEADNHKSTWMIWPYRTDTWRMGGKPAQQAYANVANIIAAFEPVNMCVPSWEFSNARKMLHKNVRVIEMGSDDAWARDTMPIFLNKLDNTSQISVCNLFNAYGGMDEGLYYPWDKDELISEKVSEIENILYFKSPLVLEGGAIDSDGEGTLITTEECLLHPNRNPNKSKEEVEQILKDYFNIEKVIWLPKGFYGDETNGHVDNICKFIRPAELLLTYTDNKKDPQSLISKQAFDFLSKQTDALGRKFNITKIQHPEPMFRTADESLYIDTNSSAKDRNANERLGANYINSYIINGAVLVPSYDSVHDHAAEETYKKLFPERKIILVPAREILLGGGSIHCITMQQPAHT